MHPLVAVVLNALIEVDHCREWCIDLHTDTYHAWQLMSWVARLGLLKASEPVLAVLFVLCKDSFLTEDTEQRRPV